MSLCRPFIVALILASALLSPAPAQAQQPARPKIARCYAIGSDDSIGEIDYTPDGPAADPSKRKVRLEFAYATRNPADNTKKTGVATATRRIEICHLKVGDASATCPGGGGFVVLGAGADPAKQVPAIAAEIVNDTEPSAPKPARVFDVDLDWEEPAGPFLIMKANKPGSNDLESDMEAVSAGGFCAVPARIDDASKPGNFEVIGVAASFQDPWMGAFGRLPCAGNRLARRFTRCLDQPAIDAFVAMTGLIHDWTVAPFGLTVNPPIWQRGRNNGIHQLRLMTFDGFEGYGGLTGQGYMAFEVDDYLDIDKANQASDAFSTLAHEYFHRVQRGFKRARELALRTPADPRLRIPGIRDISFIEGSATAIEQHACIPAKDLPFAGSFAATFPKDYCVSAGTLGDDASEGRINPFLRGPSNDTLHVPYDSAIFWRYFMEQFSLPVDGSAARPMGGVPSDIEADPSVPLGKLPRSPSEGADFLRHMLEQFETDRKEPAMVALDNALKRVMKRSLDAMLLDFHTAVVLKDYKETDPRWHFMWLGNFTAGLTYSDVSSFRFTARTEPLRDLKPFHGVASSPPGVFDDDGLVRATRLRFQETLEVNQTVAGGNGEPGSVLNAYGAAYASVKPGPTFAMAAPGGKARVVRVALQAARGRARFRVFTVEDGRPTLVPGCDAAQGDGPEAVEYCEADDSGQVVVNVPIDPANPVDEILAVASAGQQPAAINFAFSHAQVVLSVQTPTRERPADIGGPDAKPQRTFVLQFQVQDLVEQAGKPVLRPRELASGELRLRVGGSDIPSGQVKLVPISGGSYFATVRVPVDRYPMSPGVLALIVDIVDPKTRTPIASVELPSALEVSDAMKPVATQLVLDKSGSMRDGEKMKAMQNAAIFLLDTLRTGDPFGLVVFDQDADTRFDLKPLTSTTRSNARMAIEGLSPGGCTSIGDGLLEAQSNFIGLSGDSPSSTDIRWNLLLLSDGIGNSGHDAIEFYGDQRPPLSPRRDGDGTGGCGEPDPNPGDTKAFRAGTLNYFQRRRASKVLPVVSTLAFGQDADLAELSAISDATGGVTTFVDTFDTSQRIMMALELSDAFRSMQSHAEGFERIGSGLFATSGDLEPFPVEPGAEELQVSIAKQSAVAGLELIEPGNTANHSPVAETDKTIVFRVPHPKPGEWSFSGRIIRSGPTPPPTVFVEQALLPGTDSVSLFATADVDVVGRAVLGEDDRRWAGRPVTVRALLTRGSGVLIGVPVLADVTTPTGQHLSLALIDDGKHDDGASGDGVYGTVLRETSAPGAYKVRVSASALLPDGFTFQRERLLSFILRAASDTDGDTVPDFRDPNPTVSDGNADPDGDDLTNIEEHVAGTDPKNPDTDGGGENDGSEKKGTPARDPHDPADDAVDPFMARLQACVGEAVLQFAIPSDSFQGMDVSAGPTVAGPFTTIFTGPVPAGGLLRLPATNGVERCYRLRVRRTASGPTSTWSPPLCGTPKLDSAAPTISLALAQGGTATQSTKAAVDVLAADGTEGGEHGREDLCPNDRTTGVKDMMISTDSGFVGASWQPYKRAIEVSVKAPGSTVFAKVRDGAGNVSEVASLFVPVVQPKLTELVLRAVEGIRIGANASIIGMDGLASAVANGATKGDTLIGPKARTVSVWSRPGVTMEPDATVDGFVTTGDDVVLKAGARIAGSRSEHASFDVPSLPSVRKPKAGRTSIVVKPGKTEAPRPAAYKSMTVSPTGILRLSTGTYVFDCLSVSPGGSVVLDQSRGPIVIQVLSKLVLKLRFRPFLIQRVVNIATQTRRSSRRNLIRSTS